MGGGGGVGAGRGWGGHLAAHCSGCGCTTWRRRAGPRCAVRSGVAPPNCRYRRRRLSAAEQVYGDVQPRFTKSGRAPRRGHTHRGRGRGCQVGGRPREVPPPDCLTALHIAGSGPSHCPLSSRACHVWCRCCYLCCCRAAVLAAAEVSSGAAAAVAAQGEEGRLRGMMS